MNPATLLFLRAVLIACFLAHPSLQAADADLSLQTNWFPRLSPTMQTLWSVAYGDGRWVAVGNAGTILNSEGGGQWTAVPSTFQGDLYAVRKVNGLFMAGTTNGILVSPDGQQWTYRPVPVPSMTPDLAPVRFSDFAFGLGHFVAVAKYNDRRGTCILSSPDGVTWTERYVEKSTEVLTPDWKTGLTFGGDRFVLVGPDSQTISGQKRFLVSSDALAWTPVGPSYQTSVQYYQQPSTVTYGNGLFMAAGHTGPGPFVGYLYRSTNGTAWNVLGSGSNIHQGTFSSIAYGAGRFIALGFFAIRVSTNNGASWTGNDTLGPTINWYRVLGVCYGGGTFVAVGVNGTIIQSAIVEDTRPFFITTPTNQVVQRGSTAILRSMAGGSGPLSYQWRKDGDPLLNATNSALAISNAQPSDAGSYTVVVSSPFGSITNSPAALTVSFLNIASYAGLTIDGIPGRTYRVDYLNAFDSSSQWKVLTNLVLPSSRYIWIDYESPEAAPRFYRASELP
jgi:hypothetical protein